MSRPTYRATTTQQVLGVVLGMLIAIVATLLLVHWMACSQATGTALCMGATAMPRWWHLRNRLAAMCRRLHRCWLTRQLAEAQRRVQHWKTLQLEDAACRLHAEDRVAEIQRALHHLGRQP